MTSPPPPPPPPPPTPTPTPTPSSLYSSFTLQVLYAIAIYHICYNVLLKYLASSATEGICMFCVETQHIRTATAQTLSDIVQVDCRKEADVAFVVDSSFNLLYGDFRKYILGTIVDIIRRLIVDLGRTRVAAVRLTDTAKVRFTMQNSKSQFDVNGFRFNIELHPVSICSWLLFLR